MSRATTRANVRALMDANRGNPLTCQNAADRLGLPYSTVYPHWAEYRDQLLSEIGHQAPPPAERLPAVPDLSTNGTPVREPLQGTSTVEWAYVVRAPNGQWCRLVPLDE